MRIRICVFALVVLSAGQALAQREASCAFTFNAVSRKIEKRCQGMPTAALGFTERSLLSSGKMKVCVIRKETLPNNETRLTSPECK